MGTGWQRDAGKVRALPCHPEPPTSKPGDLSNAATLAQDGETHSWEGSGEHKGGSTHPWTHWRDGADPPAPAHGDGVMLPGGTPVPLPAGSCASPEQHLPQARPGRALAVAWTLERRSCAAAQVLPKVVVCSLHPSPAPSRAVPLWHVGSAGTPVRLELLRSEPRSPPQRAGSCGHPQDDAPTNIQQQKHIKARPDGSE